MEVAQIARTVARALGLNEDLTEAIALAHDIGHGPFGHTGEDALADLMREHGGFEHNRQARRIVDTIERKYPGFPGLNLTAEVRDSLLKHGDAQLCLEAQAVDAADRIAYNTHDVDDGLTSGIIDEDALAEVSLWRDALHEVTRRYPGLDPARRRYHVVRMLIDAAVTDLLDHSRERLAGNAPGTPFDALGSERLVAPSQAMERRQKELSGFLARNFYNDYRVWRMRRKAEGFLREMFLALTEDTRLLPPRWQEWAVEHGGPRGVCDYIASMTDREAIQEYRRLFDADAGTGPE
jgi:dGTPase